MCVIGWLAELLMKLTLTVRCGWKTNVASILINSSLCCWLLCVCHFDSLPSIKEAALNMSTSASCVLADPAAPLTPAWLAHSVFIETHPVVQLGWSRPWPQTEPDYDQHESVLSLCVEAGLWLPRAFLQLQLASSPAISLMPECLNALWHQSLMMLCSVIAPPTSC